MHLDSGCWVLHLQGPGQVAEVHGAAEPRVGLQQAHDDRHGRLVVAGAAGALLRVDHVDADVGVLPQDRGVVGIWVPRIILDLPRQQPS